MTTELGCDLGERMERAICQLHAPEMPPDLPTRVAQSASRRRMVRGVAMLALPALLLVGVVGIAYRPPMSPPPRKWIRLFNCLGRGSPSEIALLGSRCQWCSTWPIAAES
jgi:hypothetical protein